MDDAHPFKSKD
ncbi:hypothetical protein CGLO_18161 [Colletotrichum gloeosporioides Cg-14]|uniref:Uncharacterized protein n=1 Tax=Colletotrichum gloeosporioides (strain Cg-14) TaxID=1237896 RepID=T0JS10_COLGC|nr:hypothetical protein CGLO_18161 [Colletotrichum gloeosporioides Cg-14]